jgi:hypothetical protein
MLVLLCNRPRGAPPLALGAWWCCWLAGWLAAVSQRPMTGLPVYLLVSAATLLTSQIELREKSVGQAQQALRRAEQALTKITGALLPPTHSVVQPCLCPPCVLLASVHDRSCGKGGRRPV